MPTINKSVLVPLVAFVSRLNLTLSMSLFSDVVNDALKLRVIIFCESASIREKNRKLSITNNALNMKHTRAAIDSMGYGTNTF